MLDELWHAVRRLARNPRFTIGVCLILAFGIGASVAIFAVVDVSLFRQLPYRNPEQLVQLDTYSPEFGYGVMGVGGERQADLRALTHVFVAVDPFRTATRPTTFRGRAAADPVYVGRMSPRLLGTLGIVPVVGRGFAPEEAVREDVVLLGDAFWRREFGADPAVLGRALVLGDRVCTVIGVVPSTLRYAVGPPQRQSVSEGVSVGDLYDHDAWWPLADDLRPAAEGYWEGTIARIRPGLTASQAVGEVRRSVQHLTRLEPGLWHDREVRFAGLGRAWQQPPREAVEGLFGAVAFVLLIACSNVASLLLTRALNRREEVAIRASLGATRGRLAGQFMLEGLALAGVSSIAAVLVARWVVAAVPLLAPGSVNWLYAAYAPRLDSRAVLFAVMVTLFTGVVCGAAPALRASSWPATGLRPGQFVLGESRRRQSLTRGLEAAQVALTLALVAGFVVLLSSFIRIARADLGFDPTNLVFANIKTRAQAGERKIPDTVLEDVHARVRRLPGVLAATLAPDPASGYVGARVSVETEPDRNTLVFLATVPWDYFTITGIRLVEGRAFRPDDGVGPPVAIVSEAMGRALWPGQRAVGQRIRQADAEWITVIGVAATVKTWRFTTRDRSSPTAWLIARERDPKPSALLVRTQGDTTRVQSALRTVIRAVDPSLEISRSGEVKDLYRGTMLPARFYAFLAGLLAATGLLTTGIGLFALVASAVARRTREIGLRIALGASPARVRGLVFIEAAEPLAVGLAVGLGLAYFATPLLAEVAYEMKPHGVAPIVAAAAAVVVIGFLAVIGPLARARRIEPATALRAE
jgi:putative ABC transport system permease protein